MSDKEKKADEFQQLKGFLGQEIAKLYLQKVIKCEEVYEEVEVEGLKANNGRKKSPSRLDIVAKTNDNRYIPVEVKFQEYNFENYGKAFEHVLKTDNAKVRIKEDLKPLSTPALLFLWFAPAKKIKDVKNYNKVTVFTFNFVLKELERVCGNEKEFRKELIKNVVAVVQNFLNNTEKQKSLNTPREDRLKSLGYEKINPTDL